MMPVFRTQNSGYFLNIASISGSTTAPGQAIYSATKAALILLTEAVDAEGRDFNVRATAVCPGGLRTDFLGGSARFPQAPIAAYRSVREHEQRYRQLNQNQSGDPVKAARALMSLAESADPRGGFTSAWTVSPPSAANCRRSRTRHRRGAPSHSAPITRTKRWTDNRHRRA